MTVKTRWSGDVISRLKQPISAGQKIFLFPHANFGRPMCDQSERTVYGAFCERKYPSYTTNRSEKSLKTQYQEENIQLREWFILWHWNYKMVMMKVILFTPRHSCSLRPVFPEGENLISLQFQRTCSLQCSRLISFAALSVHADYKLCLMLCNVV